MPDSKHLKISNKLRKACQSYVFEGKSKIDSLVEAGFSKSYVLGNVKKIFEQPQAQAYLDELYRKQEEMVSDLWKSMIKDAPNIYLKYKKLAEDSGSDDVKRRIWSDILDRTGYTSSKKIDIKDERLPTEDLDRELKALEDEVNIHVDRDREEETETD